MAKVARVDHEYNAEAFWAVFHWRAEALPEGAELQILCMDLTDRGHAFPSSETAAAELLAFCKAIPGYADGPEHAREAVTIEDSEIEAP
jgi:hypothetical protein